MVGLVSLDPPYRFIRGLASFCPWKA